LHRAEIEGAGKCSLHEGHKHLHVAANVGDHKEVDADARDAQPLGHQLDDDAEADADPHLADHVGGDQGVVAVGRLQIQHGDDEGRRQDLAEHEHPDAVRGVGPLGDAVAEEAAEEGAADAGGHGDHALVAGDLRLALAQEFEVGVVVVGPHIARFRLVKQE